ncbi:MFS transporter [Desulfosporosinus sp. FKB]|uniref:MFS transporter n=1 Tax=Desulfosporosinus sp. FKB TaxID=1969835 RepID=UPI001FA86D27|nr:MFS transporter [Desulfosporosinus sp. FKB]
MNEKDGGLMSIQAKAQSKFILYTIMIGAFMSMFDSGVVNVGLPVMAKQFGVDMNSVQWVTSIYLLVMSALLPILGTLADHFGRRKIYNLGFFVISIFTLFCSFSMNLPMLIIMRALQAVGGAMVMANGMAIVTENYPPTERGKNIGVLAMTMAIGSIAGPPLGGLAIGLWGWQTVFFLTFIVSILGFAASYFSIPRNKKTKNKHFEFDALGSVLLVIAIITFIYGFSNINTMGLSNPLIYGSVSAFLISSISFILYERKVSYPVMDLSLFNNWIFTSSVISSLISFITMYSPTVLIPFYYQRVLGFSTEKSGLYMMAFPIAMAVISPLSGALSDKIGATILTSSGLLINGVALILLANSTLQTPVYLILIYLALMGLSLGLFQSPNNSCIMGNVPKNKLGAANGITQLVKNLGMVIGIAFSVTLFSAFLDNTANNYGTNFLESTQKVYYIAAVMSFIGALISGIRNKNQKEE